jgi:hypothetical protein
MPLMHNPTEYPERAYCAGLSYGHCHHYKSQLTGQYLHKGRLTEHVVEDLRPPQAGGPSEFPQWFTDMKAQVKILQNFNKMFRILIYGTYQLTSASYNPAPVRAFNSSWTAPGQVNDNLRKYWYNTASFFEGITCPLEILGGFWGNDRVTMCNDLGTNYYGFKPHISNNLILDALTNLHPVFNPDFRAWSVRMFPNGTSAAPWSDDEWRATFGKPVGQLDGHPWVRQQYMSPMTHAPMVLNHLPSWEWPDTSHLIPPPYNPNSSWDVGTRLFNFSLHPWLESMPTSGPPWNFSEFKLPGGVPLNKLAVSYTMEESLDAVQQAFDDAGATATNGSLWEGHFYGTLPAEWPTTLPNLEAL